MKKHILQTFLLSVNPDEETQRVAENAVKQIISALTASTLLSKFKSSTAYRIATTKV